MRPASWMITGLGLAVVFTACDGSDPPVRIGGRYLTTGAVTAPPIAGMEYATGDRLDVTGVQGRLSYLHGDRIDFSVGPIPLGSVPGAPTITALDLVPEADPDDPAAIGLARLLFTLDPVASPGPGITIAPELIDLLYEVMDRLYLGRVDFANPAQVDMVVNEIERAAAVRLPHLQLRAVDADEARAALIRYLDAAGQYRQRVTRAPATRPADATIALGPTRVPARTADGTELHGLERPLVAIYTAQVDGAFGRDVFATVSLDGGASWRTLDVSRTARPLVMIHETGVESLAAAGDSTRPQLAVAGERLLVTWLDTSCPSPAPGGLRPEDDRYGAIGAQGSWDEHGTARPNRCLWWSALDLGKGGVRLHAARPLTSGRRDVAEHDVALLEDVGVAIAWTERDDPRRFGGADVWYRFVAWDDLVAYELAPAAPVRISDNGACRRIDERWTGPAYCADVCLRADAEGVCYTADGQRLDGRSGAVGPQVALVLDRPGGESDACVARAVVGYHELAADAVGSIRYHAFAAGTPETIAAGARLSPETGHARDLTLVAQGSRAAGAADTRVAVVYRFGAPGDGSPADVVLRRARGGYDAADFGLPVRLDELNVYIPLSAPPAEPWYSSVRDDARDPRIVLDGDRLAIAYRWSEDLAAGADYRAFLARSFDGGVTFTSADGTLELPRALPAGFEARTVTGIELASAGDALAVSFSSRASDASDEIVHLAVSRDRGDTFTMAEVLDPVTGAVHAIVPAVAGGDASRWAPQLMLDPDGGLLHAGWLQAAGTGADLWLRTLRWTPVGLRVDGAGAR